MKTYHILTLLVIFLFTGCLKEEKMSIGARIKVNMPEGYEDISPEGIDVKFTIQEKSRHQFPAAGI